MNAVFGFGGWSSRITMERMVVSRMVINMIPREFPIINCMLEMLFYSLPAKLF